MKTSKLLADYETELYTVCDTKRCTCAATMIVTIHRIDACTGLLTGDRVFLLCRACARNAAKQVNSIVDEMPPPLQCDSCGRWIRTYSDVIKLENI